MKNRMFKIVTGVAGIYHIILALAGLLCPVDLAVKVVTMAFGLALEVGPQLSLILKFTSVYMLAFGVMLMVLSINPVKYRALVIPALVLFGIRLINRVMLFDVLTSAGMPVSRNVIGTAHIFFFFIAMIILLPKAQLDRQTNANTQDN